MMDLDWIKQKMREAGLKQAEVAKRIGMEATVFNRLLNGNRRLYAEEADALRDIFGERPMPDGSRLVPVLGAAALNVWQEKSDASATPGRIALSLGQAKHAEHIYILRATDGSMADAGMPEGISMICLPLAQLPKEPEVGMKLVIAQKDKDGRVERSVAEIMEIRADGYWLRYRPRPGEMPAAFRQLPPREAWPKDLASAGILELVPEAVVMGVTSVQMFLDL